MIGVYDFEIRCRFTVLERAGGRYSTCRLTKKQVGAEIGGGEEDPMYSLQDVVDGAKTQHR